MLMWSLHRAYTERLFILMAESYKHAAPSGAKTGQPSMSLPLKRFRFQFIVSNTGLKPRCE
jgi:hypothetical protein